MKRPILLALVMLAFFAPQSRAQISISINIAPPEPFVVRPPQPSNNHIWVEGEWVNQGGHYVKQPGNWTIPPKDQIWIKGEWIHNPDGTVYWQPGYWKPVPHMGVPNWIPEPDYLRPPRPSNTTMWVSGEWIWLGDHYKYQVGYWIVPEPNKVFIRGHWAQWPNGEWYWVAGYWNRIPDNVFVNAIPPEPQFNRPPAPSPQHVWIDAEWTWQNGGFAYKPGYWIPRDPHRMWVRGYWHQRHDGNFYWVDGYWEWV